MAARSRHLNKISYSKVKNPGLVGQHRATDLAPELQAEFLKIAFEFKDFLFQFRVV